MKDYIIKFMKLIVIIMVSSFLIFILVFGYGFFYSKDQAKLKIVDFTKPKTIIVKPYKYHLYTMMNIWVKGYANDTILIKLDSKDNKPILKLSGKINERWYTDYYGEGKRILIFEPFKADKGKLEIEIKL